MEVRSVNKCALHSLKTPQKDFRSSAVECFVYMKHVAHHITHSVNKWDRFERNLSLDFTHIKLRQKKIRSRPSPASRPFQKKKSILEKSILKSFIFASTTSKKNSSEAESI